MCLICVCVFFSDDWYDMCIKIINCREFLEREAKKRKKKKKDVKWRDRGSHYQSFMVFGQIIRLHDFQYTYTKHDAALILLVKN